MCVGKNGGGHRGGCSSAAPGAQCHDAGGAVEEAFHRGAHGADRAAHPPGAAERAGPRAGPSAGAPPPSPCRATSPMQAHSPARIPAAHLLFLVGKVLRSLARLSLRRVRTRWRGRLLTVVGAKCKPLRALCLHSRGKRSVSITAWIDPSSRGTASASCAEIVWASMRRGGTRDVWGEHEGGGGGRGGGRRGAQCDHGVWLTAAHALGSGFASFLPGVGRSVEDGLLRWLRAAELTCDRAALLVVQARPRPRPRPPCALCALLPAARLRGLISLQGVSFPVLLLPASANPSILPLGRLFWADAEGTLPQAPSSCTP